MTREWWPRWIVTFAVAIGVAMGAASVAANARAAGLHVSGDRLLDGAGHAVALHGVNRSGTEYACIQGWGIFDGPSDAVSVRAIASWHVNFVRVPINEDCWLGIGGVSRQYGGAAYRRAITSYVRLLHRYGMYAEISLIWAAPGRERATTQPIGPDEDHAPAVWAGMARAFRHDSKVILAPWGETELAGGCFERGGGCGPYRIAGMQQAVDVMRRAGYRGVISIPGLNYANNLTHWLADEPRDPRGQLIAEAHVYGKSSCSSTRCLNATMAPVARRVPLIFAEYGESYDASSCGSAHTSVILHWADAHHVGYAAWVWDTWQSCLSLISSYNGTPANAYGRFVKAHYAGTASSERHR